MPRRKIHVKPGTKVGLTLSEAERNLILGLMRLDEDYEEIVRETPPEKAIQLTLDEWDDFGGYIAAEANHNSDKKLQKKLDAIFEKIQNLLETHTDEEPQLKVFDPETADTEDFTDKGFLLGLAAQLQESREKTSGKPQTCHLKLTKPQREALLEHGNLSGSLRDRLQDEARGPRNYELDLVELMAMAIAISKAGKSATGRVQKSLLRVAVQVAAGFTSRVGSPKEKGSRKKRSAASKGKRPK
ncbi:MAG: hypothetical protein ABIP48_26860 [Planctomycetota bacterium]